MIKSQHLMLTETKATKESLVLKSLCSFKTSTTFANFEIKEYVETTPFESDYIHTY